MNDDVILLKIMLTFSIAGDFDTTADALFGTDEKGHLNFGWTGKSAAPSSIHQLCVTPVEFRDYIMEGSLAYRVLLKRVESGAVLEVTLTGTNRDQYVQPQIRHYIGQAGLQITCENAG